MTDPNMTLVEAREWLRDRVDDGAKCPCCEQFARVYRRKIHATMAADLIRVWRSVGQDWAHVGTVLSGRAQRRIHPGDFAKLTYWGLIVEESERRPDGGRAGWWQITNSGVAYVRGQIQMQKYARIYDGRCLGLIGPYVGIHDALGDKFSYAELMAS